MESLEDRRRFTSRWSSGGGDSDQQTAFPRRFFKSLLVILEGWSWNLDESWECTVQMVIENSFLKDHLHDKIFIFSENVREGEGWLRAVYAPFSPPHEWCLTRPNASSKDKDLCKNLSFWWTYP